MANFCWFGCWVGCFHSWKFIVFPRISYPASQTENRRKSTTPSRVAEVHCCHLPHKIGEFTTRKLKSERFFWEVSSFFFRDAKNTFYTRTFQFGWQKVPLPGCQFTIFLGFNRHPDWKLLVGGSGFKSF